MSNQQVLEKIEAGFRMEPPQECPEYFSAIMLTCWASDPKQRPSFIEINTTVVSNPTPTSSQAPSSIAPPANETKEQKLERLERETKAMKKEILVLKKAKMWEKLKKNDSSNSLNIPSMTHNTNLTDLPDMDEIDEDEESTYVSFIIPSDILNKPKELANFLSQSDKNHQQTMRMKRQESQLSRKQKQENKTKPPLTESKESLVPNHYVNEQLSEKKAKKKKKKEHGTSLNRIQTFYDE